MQQREIAQLRQRLAAYEEEQLAIRSKKIEMPSQLSERQQILFTSIVSSIYERQDKLQNVRNNITQTLMNLIHVRFDNQIKQTSRELKTSINQSSESLTTRIQKAQTTLDEINNSDLPSKRWWIQFAFILFTLGSGVMTILFLFLSNFQLILQILATVFLVGCLCKVVIDTLRLYPSWKKRIQHLYGYAPILPLRPPGNPQQTNRQPQQRLPPSAQNFTANISDNLVRDPNS